MEISNIVCLPYSLT